MRISEMNWMMVEEYLRRDDRAVLPLGCTEQHAYLSLSTDSILAERLAVEAAEPLGVPVFPVLAYGITPYFRAFPGTITLRVKTYMSVVGDILDAIAEHGFKRILIVNGHGGNTPVQGFVGEWIADHPGSADQVPQLVERAQSLGASSGNRSRRFPRIVDGKFSVDAPNEGRGTFPAEGDERPGEITTPRPEVSAGTSQRRQLRRTVPTRRRRNDEDLADRRGRDARVADGRVGLDSIGGSASPEDDDS